MVKRIQQIYEELHESIYTDGDHPGPLVKRISADASIPKSLVDELRDRFGEEGGLGNELDSEDSEDLARIRYILREDGPIDKYASFNESEYAEKEVSDLSANSPYDENADYGEIAGQRAGEKRSELLNEAAPDIGELMEELLPKLLNK
ncbi:hypothetical protein MZM54_00010 [[Brevibacterium] frigoritolerans]|nr:hypothetical protein [Peribacillus frigoritolerans]